MIKLSILICSIYERAGMLAGLLREIYRQIEENEANDIVEVLTEIDNKGEHSIGYKRNILLRKAKGEWISFADDDDAISGNYLKLILDGLKTNPDVCSLTGSISFNGENPKPFIHSIKNNSYYETPDAYMRFPNHLNTIRSSIAKQFSFPHTFHGEDTDFATQIHESGLLKVEHEIPETIYFYKYITNK